MTNEAPSNPRASATARGTRPNSATAAPISTQIAGTYASEEPSSNGRRPASSLPIASAVPAPSPVAPATTTVPAIAMST
jgi:hypothetical protein